MMGSGESKVESKTEEQGSMLLLPSPSSSSATIAESLDEDLGKITLQEKPDGGGLTHEDTGLEESPTLDNDLMPSHEGKSERSHYPQRPGEPDCSFYLKTGSCRYGSNCKFDHPLRRKRNKAKSKKQSETIQKAAKEKENDTSSEKVGTEGKEVINKKQNDALSKMMEQNNGKDVKEKEKATPLETVGKEEYQSGKGKQDKTLPKMMDQTNHKMAAEEKEAPSEREGQTRFKATKEKENESPSKKVGKTEGKRVMNEKQNEALSKRMEQKNGKDDNEKQKTTPSEMVGKEGYKACKGKQDKTPPKMMDQKDHKKAVEEKETPSEREGRTKLKKAAKEKETPSEKLGRTESKTVMNEKQNEALSRRMEQKNGKDVKEKATPSETVGNEEYKSGKGKQDKTLSRMMDQTYHKNYSMPGACKSGKACKFTHFNGKSEVAQVELNFLGLPMRPGESVCSYYMHTGGCKYATNCRYHHPDPTAVVGDSTISRDQTGGSAQEHASGASALPITSWPLHGNSSQPVPFFAPGFLPFPPHGLYPNPEWNVYQAPVFTPPNLNTRNSAASEVHQVDEYPERPGQPECHYFMRSGECKFKLACRFHHPRGRPQKDLPVRVSPP